MSSRYTTVELLDIVNDRHLHSEGTIETAIDLLEARGVLTAEKADTKRAVAL